MQQRRPQSTPNITLHRSKSQAQVFEISMVEEDNHSTATPSHITSNFYHLSF